MNHDLRRWIRRLPPLDPPITLAHSPIGPSGATRLQECPGSYGMSQALRKEEATTPPNISEAAERGTMEHTIAEEHLRAGTMPEIVLGVGEAAAIYIETLARWAAKAAMVELLLVEEMLDGRRLHPLLFGTVDGAMLWRDANGRLTLTIFDLKSGVYVVPAGALQLMLYAALVLTDPRTRDAVKDVWQIETVVVQPSNGGASRAQHTTLSILRTALRYLEAARTATMEGVSLPLVYGPWCMFCPARLECPTRTERRNMILSRQLQDAGDPDDVLLDSLDFSE